MDSRRAGDGPLTYGRILSQAWGMLRVHYWRVALVALIVFVPPQVLAVALRGLRESLQTGSGLVLGVGYLIGLAVVIFLRLAGPVVYAGYLDEAVGREYFSGHRTRFRAVLRALPWGPLVVADLVLIAGAVVGLALFVVPGVAWLTLFVLVGPVMVQEHHGVAAGFRRTLELSLHAWPKILLLVVSLLVVEQVVHETVHQLLHHHDLWLELAASWLVSAGVGGFVGLVEVALATELMARNPQRPVRQA
jgi:hypothetical protein